MEVPVTFYPREASRYHDTFTFILNDCAKQVVDILGQGIEMKVRKRSLYEGPTATFGFCLSKMTLFASLDKVHGTFHISSLVFSVFLKGSSGVVVDTIEMEYQPLVCTAKQLTRPFYWCIFRLRG